MSPVAPGLAESARTAAFLPADAGTECMHLSAFCENSCAAGLRWRLAPGVALVDFPACEALFCEAAQQLYAIDPLGALLARHMARQAVSMTDLVRFCIRQGLDGGPAAEAVLAMVRLWANAGLLTADPASSYKQAVHYRFSLAGAPVEVAIAGAGLSHLLLPVPAPERVAASSRPCWHIIANGTAGVVIARKERPARIVAFEQAVPTLKARLVEDALAASERIALHAAALVCQDRAMLLCGQPGAGKSTLCVALTQAGFGFASDDVTLVDAQGQAQGLCFHPTLKAGSWHLLPRLRDAIVAAPEHRRLDGAILRYLPMPQPRTGRHCVGWIVLLDRRPDAPAELSPVDPVTALRTLFEGAYAGRRRSNASDVRMMSDLVASAKCLRLTYSDLQEAVALLDGLGKAG